MTMPHVEDLLARYCEKALPQAKAGEVETHLEMCPACRVAESEVRRGLRLARALEAAALPEDAALQIQRALAAAPGVRPSAPWLRIAAAAAVVFLVLSIRFPARAPQATAARPGLGGLLLEAEPGEPTDLERTALELWDAQADHRLTLDLSSSSVPEVRQWAEKTVGLSVSLEANRPPEDRQRYVVEGARRVRIGGSDALAVAYRVDGHPVALVTARASDVPGRTPEWNPGGKHVRFRTVGRRKLLAWTNIGQAYAVVSDLPGYGQQGCLLCHTTEARRKAIDALGQPLP